MEVYALLDYNITLHPHHKTSPGMTTKSSCLTVFVNNRSNTVDINQRHGV
jgi:hypothetical protein